MEEQDRPMVEDQVQDQDQGHNQDQDHGQGQVRISLQELIQLLRNPEAEEQNQSRILNMIRSNPSFMAAYVKHKAQRQQQFQPNSGMSFGHTFIF